jgi:serine protease Do
MIEASSDRGVNVSGRGGFVPLALAVMMGIVGAGASSVSAFQASSRETATGSLTPPEIEHARSLSKAFRYVARRAEPSVVHISALNRAVRRDFFGRVVGRTDQFVQSGVGSGVVISDDGYVLTNNHVVAPAEKFKVRLSDGREFDGSIVGRDPATDLAVIKVDATGLKPANFGDSDGIEVGDWVVAVGNPFGFDNTVTAGIVSAKGRALSGSDRVNEDFIQTDAPINPGNSGGPLFDLEGNVIGINSAIATRNGGSVGLGFAIPSNIARYVKETLVAKGRVDRGYLGIDMVPLTEELASRAGIKPADGIAIREVVEGSPAAKAGLKPGDVVVRYQGRQIDEVYRMRTAIALTPPNSSAVIEVIRDGEPRKLSVTVGDREDMLARSVGLTVETLTADDARRMGYRGVRGVVVTVVAPGSRAAAAELQTRDIITQVDGVSITDRDEFFRVLQDRDDADGVQLSVIRGQDSGYLNLYPLQRQR